MPTDNPHESPILVAVDFASHSEAALVWAARLAGQLRVPLEMLHVVHDPGSAPGYYNLESHERHVRRLEEAAVEMMAGFLERVRRTHPELAVLHGLEGRQVVGLPVNRILEVAAELRAQLIVMGSSGRTGLPHLMLGSKAERVVQLSPIPVTIVKDEARGGEK